MCVAPGRGGTRRHHEQLSVHCTRNYVLQVCASCKNVGDAWGCCCLLSVAPAMVLLYFWGARLLMDASSALRWAVAPIANEAAGRRCRGHACPFDLNIGLQPYCADPFTRRGAGNGGLGRGRERKRDAVPNSNARRREDHHEGRASQPVRRTNQGPGRFKRHCTQSSFMIGPKAKRRKVRQT